MLKILIIVLLIIIVGATAYYSGYSASSNEENEENEEKIEEKQVDGFSFDGIPYEGLESSMIIEPLKFKNLKNKVPKIERQKSSEPRIPKIEIQKSSEPKQVSRLEGDSISELKGDVARLEKKVNEVDKNSKDEDKSLYSKFKNYMSKTAAEKNFKDIENKTTSMINSKNSEHDNKLKKIALQQKMNQADIEARNALQAKALNDNFKKYD